MGCAGRLSVLNELGHTRGAAQIQCCEKYLFDDLKHVSMTKMQINKKSRKHCRSNYFSVQTGVTIKWGHKRQTHNTPDSLWDPPSRLSEMEWSPNWFPWPRIIQLSRPSESDESDSDSDSDSSESDSELLDSTVTGTPGVLFLFWASYMDELYMQLVCIRCQILYLFIYFLPCSVTELIKWQSSLK